MNATVHKDLYRTKLLEVVLVCTLFLIRQCSDKCFIFLFIEFDIFHIHSQ